MTFSIGDKVSYRGRAYHVVGKSLGADMYRIGIVLEWSGSGYPLRFLGDISGLFGDELALIERMKP